MTSHYDTEYLLPLEPIATLYNPLLSKAEVGRPRLRFFALPPENFTYGRKNVKIDGGTKSAFHWVEKSRNKFLNPSKQPRDFISLNKFALANGVTTAQEQTDFRANNDIRQREPRSFRDIPKSAPTNVTYGISTRPSTPINELLEYRYQDNWLRGRREQLMMELELIEERRRSFKNYTHTRSSLLRKKSAPVDDKRLWQMPRFQKVSSRVESFRKQTEKKNALKHTQTDTSAN